MYILAQYTYTLQEMCILLSENGNVLEKFIINYIALYIGNSTIMHLKGLHSLKF